ncbi:MAG: hypothetical protein IJW21_01210 [Clostridia bacterium]|nr:hypothetical protein [Clostridia bacterium]
MKNGTELLQDAIGFIGDDLIMGAQSIKKRTSGLSRFAAIAACFAIVVLSTAVGSLMVGIFTRPALPPDTSAPTTGITTAPPFNALDITGYWHNGEGSESAIYLAPDESFVYYTLVPSAVAGVYDVREQRGSYTLEERRLVLSLENESYTFDVSEGEKTELTAAGENAMGSFAVKSSSLPESFLMEYLGGLWICGDYSAGTVKKTAYYFTGDGTCNVIDLFELTQATCKYSFDGKTLVLHGVQSEISYTGGTLKVKNGDETQEYRRAALAHSLRLGISSGENAFVCPNMYLEALIWSEQDKIDFPLPGAEIFEHLTPFEVTEKPRFIISHRGALSYTLYTGENELVYADSPSFEMPEGKGTYHLDVRFESEQTDGVSNGRILHYYVTMEIK